jgi:hypothetical protein
METVGSFAATLKNICCLLQENYPLVRAHFQKVQNISEIKAYLETRPPSPLGV